MENFVRKEHDTIKVIAISQGNREHTLLYFRNIEDGKSPRYRSDYTKALANGEKLEEAPYALGSYNYYVEGPLEHVYLTSTERINVRYELKDKSLYNVSLPLIIDESTADKYQSIVQSDLYEKTYDTQEVRTYFPIEYITTEDDFPFMYKLSWGEYDRESFPARGPFLVNQIVFSEYDRALVPAHVRVTTRPIALTGGVLRKTFVDMVYVKHDPQKIRIEQSYRGAEYTFPNGDKILAIRWNGMGHSEDNDDYLFPERLYFKNYNTAIKELKDLADKFLRLLYRGDQYSPLQLITAFREEFGRPDGDKK